MGVADPLKHSCGTEWSLQSHRTAYMQKIIAVLVARRKTSKVAGYAPGEMNATLGARLLRGGRFIDGSAVEFRRMEACGCHDNVAWLCKKIPGMKHWIGFALSADGIWRLHSWAEKGGGAGFVETTKPRVMYWGIQIDSDKLVDILYGR